MQACDLDTAIELAKRTYGDISLCVTCQSWEESIVENMFWFNSSDNSTHVIRIVNQQNLRNREQTNN
jgi:hypothetical protein